MAKIHQRKKFIQYNMFSKKNAPIILIIFHSKNIKIQKAKSGVSVRCYRKNSKRNCPGLPD